MEFPLSLRSALEARLDGVQQYKLAADAQALSARYREKSGTGQRLLTTDTEAVAYAATRMPATFGAVSAALQWVLDCCDIRLETLLDAGAGTGAACWAADALLSLSEVTCLEREGAMRRLGEALMETGSPALQSARWIDRNITKENLGVTADLVVASYVLNELSEENRLKAARSLWNTAGQMLLIVEPGTPAGYAHLREIRSLLLKEGAHMAAPCPHENACPLPEDDWCHFTCRVARSRLHKQLKGGDAPYEDEKFCYLALTRQKCAPASARILRHPRIDPGKISLSLCTENGLSTREVRKKDGPLFKAARKSHCGDSFPG